MTIASNSPAFTSPAFDRDDDDAEAARERTLDAMQRCIGLLVAGIGRDHEHCGKAACKRSRRCRAFACMPAIKDDPSDDDATHRARHPFAARMPRALPG